MKIGFRNGFGVWRCGVAVWTFSSGSWGMCLIFRGKTGFWQFGEVKSLGWGFTGLVGFGTRF